ncbi:MAG: ABC transporter permease [Caldilineaceae bacterium]
MTLGRSILSNRPVFDEIADVSPQRRCSWRWPPWRWPSSWASPPGFFSAMHPGGISDAMMRLFSLIGLSMPVFWLGLVLIYIFAYYLRLLPVGGTGSWKHLILPAVTLALPSMAIVSRMTRSTMLETRREDYVRTAQAKGLAGRTVINRHILRNALIPIVTVIGLQFGQLLGGAVLTETVFAWPGLGRLTVAAIFARDYILLQGCVLVFALSFVLINTAVDISYGYIDPRTRG